MPEYRLSQRKDEPAGQKHLFSVMWELCTGFSGGRDYSCGLPENRILLLVFVNRSTPGQISHFWLIGEEKGTELI